MENNETLTAFRDLLPQNSITQTSKSTKQPVPLKKIPNIYTRVIGKKLVGSADSNSGSSSVRDKIINFFARESAEKRAMRTTLKGYKYRLQAELQVISKANAKHKKRVSEQITEFKKQEKQLSSWGLKYIIPFFRLQAWSRLSRSTLLEKISSELQIVVDDRYKSTVAYIKQFEEASSKTDRYTMRSVEEYCQPPEELMDNDQILLTLSHRLMRLDQLCNATTKRFRLFEKEFEWKDQPARRKVLHKILLKYKALPSIDSLKNIESTLTWEEFCNWYADRQQRLSALEREFSDFVEDQREKEGRLFFRWCAAMLRANNEKYGINPDQHNGDDIIPASPNTVALKMTPSSIKAFIRYFANDIIGIPYSIPRDLVEANLALTESLFFRRIHNYVLRYNNITQRNKDESWRIQCQLCRYINPLTYHVPSNYIGHEQHIVNGIGNNNNMGSSSQYDNHSAENRQSVGSGTSETVISPRKDSEQIFNDNNNNIGNNDTKLNTPLQTQDNDKSIDSPIAAVESPTAVVSNTAIKNPIFDQIIQNITSHTTDSSDFPVHSVKILNVKDFFTAASPNTDNGGKNADDSEVIDNGHDNEVDNVNATNPNDISLELDNNTDLKHDLSFINLESEFNNIDINNNNINDDENENDISRDHDDSISIANNANSSSGTTSNYNRKMTNNNNNSNNNDKGNSNDNDDEEEEEEELDEETIQINLRKLEKLNRIKSQSRSSADHQLLLHDLSNNDRLEYRSLSKMIDSSNNGNNNNDVFSNGMHPTFNFVVSSSLDTPSSHKGNHNNRSSIDNSVAIDNTQNQSKFLEISPGSVIHETIEIYPEYYSPVPNSNSDNINNIDTGNNADNSGISDKDNNVKKVNDRIDSKADEGRVLSNNSSSIKVSHNTVPHQSTSDDTQLSLQNGNHGNNDTMQQLQQAQSPRVRNVTVTEHKSNRPQQQQQQQQQQHSHYLCTCTNCQKFTMSKRLQILPTYNEYQYGRAYARASKVMSWITTSITPREIIMNLSLAYKWLLRDAIDVSGSRSIIGADLLVPLFTLVVINAQIPNINMMLQFLMEYGDYDEQGDVSYNIANLEGSILFILAMDIPVEIIEQFSTTDICYSIKASFQRAAKISNRKSEDHRNVQIKPQLHDNNNMSTPVNSSNNNTKGVDTGTGNKGKNGNNVRTRSSDVSNEDVLAMEQLGEWLRDQQTMEDTITILQKDGWMA